MTGTPAGDAAGYAYWTGRLSCDLEELLNGHSPHAVEVARLTLAEWKQWRDEDARSEAPMAERPPLRGSVVGGAYLIHQERLRQQQVEGWTPEHDDEEHTAGELVMAATAYAHHAVGQINGVCWPDEEPDVPADWPWLMDWWKPSDDPIRNLVKAGALIAAEIDRLQRLR